MGDEEEVTAADVAAAEAEALEAEALVAELEHKVRNGDETITIDDITAQEQLGRFAKLRLEATRKKAERTKAARRLEAAKTLHDEIESYALGSGKKLAKQLRAIEDAETAFLATAEEHNAKLRSWRQRAVRWGVPVTDGRPVPPAHDGRVAVGRDETSVHAGRRHIQYVEGKNMIEQHHGPGLRPDLYAHLESVDAVLPEPTAQHFYRGEGGAVIAYDNPFTDEEIKRMHLVKLTRKEAWGDA
jgi:hypothetical protein